MKECDECLFNREKTLVCALSEKVIESKRYGLELLRIDIVDDAIGCNHSEKDIFVCPCHLTKNIDFLSKLFRI